jgi:hypothetical protein
MQPVSKLQIEFDLFATPARVVPALPVLVSPPATITPGNFRWPAEPEFERATARIKLADNLAALRLLKQLAISQRPATTAEQAVLARYNGWGGLALVFEANPRAWQAEAEELKTLLTDEEYRSARATVNTAFYTPWAVTKAIYQALEQFGFSIGRVLEPAAGPGIFLAAQPDGWKLDWHAVELDTISGRILKQLQPQAQVQICGLQNAVLSDGTFDLVIGNLPFGNFPIHDRRLGNPLVHDYFLLRAVELVRPGGIVAVITSRGTLDKTNPEIRQRLAAASDLLGAIRLPESTFARRALTTVTTDILFLQRRTGQTGGTCAWTLTGKTADDEIEINRYFIQHPEMIIGSMVPNVGLYGDPACQLKPANEFAERMAAAIQKLPANCYQPQIHSLPEAKPALAEPDILATVKESGYVAQRDGSVWRRENHVLVKLASGGAKRIQRIRGLLKIRDAARAYLAAQSGGSDDAALETLRIQLNQTYDRFTGEHGPVSTRANQLALVGDPDLPFLMALEDFDGATQTATKAACFVQRTLDVQTEIIRADTAADALVYSLHEKGRVDLDYMGTLTGKSIGILLDELAGRIFLNPETSQWETADDYLSGDVAHKLRVVKKLRRPDLAGNLAALQAAQPAPLGPGEIRLKLGAPWIPTDIIQQFAVDLLAR